MISALLPDHFLARAVMAGLGVAFIAGPLGCFVVWRRMAYFGDTLAHTALLGVALAVLIEVSTTPVVLVTVALIALGLAWFQQQRTLTSDSLLGLLAHASLALSLVILASMDGMRINVMSYLFGDILAVSADDILWIYGGVCGVALALFKMWRPLLALTLHEDLAQAEGINVAFYRTAFTLILAVVIALAMQIFGALLIGSLLLIPAATSRHFCTTPEQMAVSASIIGGLCVLAGLGASLKWDSPAGPSIVVAELILFLIVTALASGWAVMKKFSIK